jgi:hypothetical protein
MKTKHQIEYIKEARNQIKENNSSIGYLKKDLKNGIDDIFEKIEERLKANASMKATIEAIENGTITKARKGIIGEL